MGRLISGGIKVGVVHDRRVKLVELAAENGEEGDALSLGDKQRWVLPLDIATPL